MPPYRRLRWFLGFALLLAIALGSTLGPRRPQLVVYNDLATPLNGAVVRIGETLLPIPPLPPGASVTLPVPVTTGPVELLLTDAEPVSAGWINPQSTARLTIHLLEGPSALVTTTPTLAARVRRWLN
jgi:hypothetical protein